MTIIKLISLYPKMPIAGVFRSKGYIKHSFSRINFR